jgi:hypothetical protein
LYHYKERLLHTDERGKRGGRQRGDTTLFEAEDDVCTGYGEKAERFA